MTRHRPANFRIGRLGVFWLILAALVIAPVVLAQAPAWNHAPQAAYYGSPQQAAGQPSHRLPVATNYEQPRYRQDNSNTRCGVMCGGCDSCRKRGWKAAGPVPWQSFSQGEYIGPHRTKHVPEYRLRVDDLLEFVYRLTREEVATPYMFNVGDRLRIESLTEQDLRREQEVPNDGTITVHLLGRIKVTAHTVEALQKELETKYKKYYKRPDITVTPIKVNTKLDDLRASVDSRFGRGGQGRQARVTPEGTIQLPAVESIPALGLTLGELKRELDHRYDEVVEGIEVTPVLVTRAPRYVYVLGEVTTSGRYEMTGPTTLMQALSLAGGWNGAQSKMKQVVVFRRDENWQLVATRVNILGALNGKQPCPQGEIWLRDSDIVLVPKHPVQRFDEWVDLIFTRGIYGVMPNQGVSFGTASRL